MTNLVLNFECLFCTGFFLQKYKNSEPKCEPELPYINTEGLSNVISSFVILPKAVSFS